MEDRSGMLALLRDDDYCVRVHVDPAGRRSLLAEMATKNVLERRGLSREMGGSGSGSGRGLYGHARGGERSVYRAEMGHRHSAVSVDRGGGVGRVTKQAWSEEREMWPVRDTDGVGSWQSLRRPVVPSSKMPLCSVSNYALNSYQTLPGSGIRGLPVPYVSSYQMDHCQFRPTSPRVPAAEFPRQSSRPDLVSGNFVIGEGIAEPPVDEYGQRRSPFIRATTGADYGSFYNKTSPSVCPHRCTEEAAFVSSLRRYPSSPDRSKSVDILQSMAYLQQNVNNKNIQAKTLRYLRDKAREVETELQRLQDKLAKKGINDELISEMSKPSRDYSPKYKETKSSFLREHTVFKHKNKLKMKRSHSYENYNYLKSSSLDFSKTMANKRMDVRYLTDITSELRKFIDGNDELMQVTLCPKLSKRYMDHCRLHHKKSTDRGTLFDGPDQSPVGDENNNSGTSRQGRNARPPKICCHCRKPIPCGCMRKRMTREEFIVLKINEWLEDIPIYPNETFLEKALRDDLIKKLKSSLVRLPPGPTFFESARKYIEECVEKLPMWRPDSKAEQELLQKQVANNLMQKLEGVAAFAIDKEIIDAFENVKFKLKDSNSMLVNRYDLMKDVTDQLREMVQNRPADDESYREQLRLKVADILAELPIETRPGKKRETLDKLADEITDKLMKIQSEVVGGSNANGSKPQGFFDQRAENILKSIPGMENISDSERSTIKQEIATKLQEIRHPSNAAELKDVMLNILGNVVKKTGFPINEERQKKLAERLTGQVTAASGTGTEEKMIWKIVEKIPELESVKRPDLNKSITEFAKKIKDIKKSGSNNFTATVQEETAKFIDTLQKNSGKSMKPEAISRMKHKISDEVNQNLQEYFDSPRSSVDSGKVRMISKWLEDVEHFLDAGKEVRNKMAAELARKLNIMQKEGQDINNTMPEEIVKSLRESGVLLNPDEEDEIVGDLMSKIDKIMVETTEQENAIWEIIDAMPSLKDIDPVANYRAVKDLAMKLEDLKLHGGTNEDIQEAIKSFTDDISQKTGVKPRASSLVDKLATKFQITPEKKTQTKQRLGYDTPSLSDEDIKSVVHSEVAVVLNETSVPLDRNTQRELESLLADQVMRGKTGTEAMEEVSRFLRNKGNLSRSEADSVARSLTNNIDSKLSTSFDQSHDIDKILDFMDQLTDPSMDSQAVKTKKNKLAKGLAKKIQHIKADPKTSKKDKEIKIRDETEKVLEQINFKTDMPVKQLAQKLVKKLDTVPARSSTPISGDRNVGLSANVSNSDIALSPITSDTLITPKRGKTPKSTKNSTEHLDRAVRDWFAQKRINIPEDKMKKLALQFDEWMRQGEQNAEYDSSDEENSLKNRLKQWLEDNTDLDKMYNFSSLIDSLLERLKSVPMPSGSRTNGGDKHTGPENASELTDWLTRWCDELPLETGSSPEDQAKLNASKQNLVSKLMLKIGALNMNPETLNDDFLYENMVSDEIDQLLDEFPQSHELVNSKAKLKKDLLDIIISAKQNIKEELAGNSYRQQIKDAVKKMLPCVCRSEAVQEKFEGLRSNIADAFISVVTAVDDRACDAAIAKYNEEIDRYIFEYTRDTGGRPNAAELKRNLIKELRNIQRPSSAALKSQLEEISVRDEVKSWIRQLPLHTNLTAEEEVQMNKIISVLALRLRELEKQNQSNPEPNYGQRLQSEISKWLAKLPLQREVDFSALAPRFAELFKVRVRPDVKSIPFSNLSASDRAHMDRIRSRSTDDEDWAMGRLCPSASGRPCMATITEDSCQTSTCQPRSCRSFSRDTAANSFKCCQNSTQTISCKASQTCFTPQQCLSKSSAIQTQCLDRAYLSTQDQSQCVRSSGYSQAACRAPSRFNVTTPCGSSAYHSTPCNATYDTSCSPYPTCASHGPPCLQGLSSARPPSCLMKRTFRDRPRSSVQIEEPADHGCRDHRAPETRYYKESGTNVEVTPRCNYVQRQERGQGSWYSCQRPPELSRNTCSDQRGPMRCRKRRDWRRRSILSSKGPCKSCAEPIIKCNRLCTTNCPYPSFLYFRN